MKRYNLFLPDEMVEKYQKLAEKRHVSAAKIMRLAMEKYLQAVEKAQNPPVEAHNGQ